MNYWVIADTHFGHRNLLEYCDRPEDFNERILKGLKQSITEKDVLIHLGDFCIGNHEKWHRLFRSLYKCKKKWLVKGNHDSKSNSWYLDHGWDCVVEKMVLKLFGANILFSHCPISLRFDSEIDINIHGHLHNIKHRKEEYQEVINQKHRLISIEHEYLPFNLRTIVEKEFTNKHGDLNFYSNDNTENS